jgi:hypothetical protein
MSSWSGLQKNAGWLMKAYFFFDKMGIDKVFNHFLPICVIKGTLPHNLTKRQIEGVGHPGYL